MKTTRSSIALLLCTCIVCAPTAYADNNSKLKQVSEQIANIKAKLGSDKAKRQSEQNQLAQTEKELANLEQAMQLNKQQLNDIDKQLQQLQQQNNDLQQKMQQQQHLLANQIANSYRLGEQPFLKLMLSERNPEYIQRLLMYYKYFNQQRIDTIKRFKQTLNQLDDNLTASQQAQLKLDSIQQKHIAEQKQYRASLKNRQRLLVILDKRINSKQQKLAQLRANKQALAQAIRQASKKANVRLVQNTAFAKQKGLYPWPTQGSIQQRYGSSIDGSELKRDGVLIQADSGQPVHAIANGRVIFAKWMAGYGQLIIIDHGNGYMTLYGRNQTLLKRVGDTVQAGQIIATVGRTGGYKKTGLYFAIRHNARPLNPSQWCHRA